MAEKQTAARPYAEAVFALAHGHNALTTWSEMLALIAAVATDENMQRLTDDPRVDRVRFLELFLGVCGQSLTGEGANFVRLLVENRRLNLLPEIVAQFELLKAEAESRLEATVVSAFPLDAAQLKSLEQGLKRKLGRDVHLSARVDSALVGGVVIRAGDLVIDGSVKGRLTELASFLSH
jgi:F-type H+-transporting ATPase subunit delta